MNIFQRLAMTAVALLAATCCRAQEITVTSLKPGGVYAVGEKIAWKVGVTGTGAADISKIAFVLKRGGMAEMGKGELTLKDGSAELDTQLDAPGTVLAEFSIPREGRRPIRNWAGAVAEPGKITPSAEPPSDFDAFWQAKIKELAAVPMNPSLESSDSGSPTVDYWKITLDNIRGTKIQGQLAKPKTGNKFPALLIVQWAGVYPLDKRWATDRAKEGWLTLNINAHNLPIDQPADFYQEKSRTTLQNYPAIGNEDKETSYFLRMYLSCYRAADYLASRDDWDGKTLVVMGTSQGGLQSLMIAGLHPKITALLANVPAGCDQSGPTVGRAPGWPNWYFQVGGGKDPAKVREAMRYYDVSNFVRRIKCPALVSCGLIDQTCPPGGVMSAFNLIPGDRKELVVMEWSDHQGRNNTQAPFNIRSGEWLRQLAKGDPPPIHKTL